MKFCGTVIKGNEVGERFAVATANLEIDSLDLEEGVYFVTAQVQGDMGICHGLLHFGQRKTFGAGFSAEVHLLDFSGDLYGKILDIETLHCERPVRKFRNADALFTQIETDIARARKFFLRREIKICWKHVSEKEKVRLAEKAVQHIAHHQRFIAAENVFLYASVDDELPIEQILCSKFQKKRYFFPRVEGEEMKFYESGLEDLQAGTFGILEPDIRAETAPSRLPKKNDIIFVPSVATDTYGNRLGRGGGYYDRFLLDCPAWKLAVVPAFAHVEKIPTEMHDVKVDEAMVV